MYILEKTSTAAVIKNLKNLSIYDLAVKLIDIKTSKFAQINPSKEIWPRIVVFINSKNKNRNYIYYEYQSLPRGLNIKDGRLAFYEDPMTSVNNTKVSEKIPSPDELKYVRAELIKEIDMYVIDESIVPFEKDFIPV